MLTLIFGGSVKQKLYQLFLLIGVLSLPLSLSASTAKADSSLLFGQKQAYSAIIRADGKVVTYAKIFLNNASGAELKKTSFSVPEGVEISNLSIYQILLPERCTSTKPETKDNLSQDYDYTYGYTPTCADIENQAYTLDEYGYYSYYNRDDTQLRYKNIPAKQDGRTYNLTLPEPIKDNKRGAYLVSYVADKGYTSGVLGLYSLIFKTLSVPQSVKEVRVAIDVSEDLYTKAGRSSISSATKSSISEGMSVASDSAAIENKGLDELQGSIGTGGSFTKTGKSLVPNEVFVVEGEFADAPWKLYLTLIIGLLAGLGLLIGLIIFLLKKANQPIRQQPTKEKTNESGK